MSPFRLLLLSATSCLLWPWGLVSANELGGGAGDGSGTFRGSAIADLSLIDRVVVRKASRRMDLYRRGQVVRTYKIALGLRPTGHKQQEGDFRTPEGRYTLERRNPQSDYFLSIQISYPNSDDVAHAKKLGVSPGNAIMIHGLPNIPRKSMDYYSRMDWTDGCIAVNNSDMVEIWLMTAPGTPIEILP